MKIQNIQDKFVELSQEFLNEIVNEYTVFIHAGQYAVYGGIFAGYEKELREYAYNYIKLRYIKYMHGYGYEDVGDKFQELFREFAKEY